MMARSKRHRMIYIDPIDQINQLAAEQLDIYLKAGKMGMSDQEWKRLYIIKAELAKLWGRRYRCRGAFCCEEADIVIRH